MCVFKRLLTETQDALVHEAQHKFKEGPQYRYPTSLLNFTVGKKLMSAIK